MKISVLGHVLALIGIAVVAFYCGFGCAIWTEPYLLTPKKPDISRGASSLMAGKGEPILTLSGCRETAAGSYRLDLETERYKGLSIALAFVDINSGAEEQLALERDACMWADQLVRKSYASKQTVTLCRCEEANTLKSYLFNVDLFENKITAAKAESSIDPRVSSIVWKSLLDESRPVKGSPGCLNQCIELMRSQIKSPQ